MMFVMLTAYFANIWRLAFGQIARARALCSEGSPDDVTTDSPPDAALGVASIGST
jgi:hypothetical protein